MTARGSHHVAAEPSTATAKASMITSASVVTYIVVRAAGIVPARLDLSHVGAAEQQLGLSLGTMLVYMRSGTTARAVAEAWGQAAPLARTLSPAVAGRRPLVVGPSTVAAMVRLASISLVTASAEAARADGSVPAVLRIEVGPVTWEVYDATAYASMLRAWRQAARLLGDNPTEDE